ncbi:MAG: chemotaxis protein CheW [Dehalococcoidales bacterium]
MAKDTAVTEKQVVLFELGGETYGLDIATVHEIIRMQPVTKVPKAPSYVEGVINLRGKVIAVIDLGKKFGMEKVERGKNNRTVVVNIQDTTIGIIVDAVTEVLRIPADSIESAAGMIAFGHLDYLQGVAKVGEKMVILLALDKLLSGDRALATLAARSSKENPELAGVK